LIYIGLTLIGKHGREQMAEMQKVIDAEKSDLFDVLAHVAYALPTLTREERAANAKVEIAESNVMTLRVVAGQDSTRGDVRAFWRIAKDPFQEINVEKLQPLFETEAKKNSKLVVLVKIDRKAKYRYMVDIIDQLQFAELNRFSLAPLLPEEKKEVESL